jgi:hypothetical protein
MMIKFGLQKKLFRVQNRIIGTFWALRQIYFIIIYLEQMKQLIIKISVDGF